MVIFGFFCGLGDLRLLLRIDREMQAEAGWPDNRKVDFIAHILRLRRAGRSIPCSSLDSVTGGLAGTEILSR